MPALRQRSSTRPPAPISHLALVERLLEAGRHVYVDKPLDAGYAGAERLVRLAQRRKRSLIIGLNRRYAPDYAALRRLSRDLIVMEKHRADLPAAPDLASLKKPASAEASQSKN